MTPKITRIKESDNDERVLEAVREAIQNSKDGGLSAIAIELNNDDCDCTMTFGEAVEAMEAGHAVARHGWNGASLGVFKQIPAEISINLVPKMQSLPQSVKDELMARHNSQPKSPDHASIRYSNQYAMLYPDNNIYGWVASPTDISSDDWFILS